MKKIYSIVLMATMLLVGTNMWAAPHDTQQTGDVAKITIGSTVKYSADLKEAFDYVTMDQTATIDLLDHVSNLSASITMPATINATDLANKAGQNITLKLNGFNISAEGKSLFRLVKGTLNITGKGTLSLSGTYSKPWLDAAVIVVGGHEDPTKTNWSNLTIGKEVTLSRAQGNGEEIGILVQDHDNLPSAPDPLAIATGKTIAQTYGYCTKYSDPIANTSGYHMACGAPASSNKQWSQGSAFGVNITVAGTINAYRYGMKIQGHVNQTPICSPNGQFPNITIESTATIFSSADGGCCGIYASGYGVWNIKGTVYGASGIYAKAGEVTLKDANISSNSTTSALSGGKISGVGQAAGTAIVIESNNAYSGEQGVTISGDTKVTGNGGYAIYDQTYIDDGTSTTSHITVEGGTIEQGAAGGVAVAEQTTGVVAILGGNVEGTTVDVTGSNGQPTGETVTVTSLVPQDDNHHTTVVEDEAGNKTVVVSEGPAPQVTSTWADITLPENAGKNVNWNVAETVTITTGNTVTLGELQMLAGTNTTAQKITVQDGAKLDVQHLIMNDYAEIIVEAGGKLIVQGEQGIVAKKVTNIKLEAEEGKSAYFLFNPAVTSNRHPNATVEFVSRSFTVSSSNYAFQRFGIPTNTGKLTSIATKYNNADVATYFAAYDYAADDWAGIGYINYPSKPALDLTKLANPFEYYQMQHNTPNMGTVVTMKGELVGNEIPQLTARAGIYNGYANSCMSPMQVKVLINELVNQSVQSAIYLNNVQAHQTVWESYTLLSILTSGEKYIEPMQPFLILNGGAAANVDLSYADAVYYTPKGSNLPKPNPAPARDRNLSNITLVNMIVNGANGSDHVLVGVDDEFSAEFDNGYDAVKFMNEGINMYVTAGEKMSIFATDNLENTYVGFDAANGTYTMEFANVQGEELTLIDLETGAKVLMVEGNTYEFTANGANDYRFQIVESAKVPTAIDNTEAVKSTKGIYTITGQYLGEMNVWNTLPAGVYVVNGEKLVK